MEIKKTTLRFSPQEYFFIIASFIVSLAGLYYGRSFLIPFCFSILISFILIPIVRFFEKKWKFNTILAIIFTFVLVVLVIGGVLYFFSSQIADIVSDFESFKSQFDHLVNEAIDMYNAELFFLPPIDSQWVIDKIQLFLKNFGGSILSSTLTQTTAFLANFILIPVYVFLLLLYRRGIVSGIQLMFRREQRLEVKNILYEVQSVGTDYIVGLSTVMLILAVLNSICLLIIGVDYAIMFGTLAALLIIIPYIGTYLGAILPILYALVTMGPNSAFFVLIAFVCTQALEGNFLTPKIVGSNTSVNALAAFVALVIGGGIWGIAGMVLSIPFVAMLKKIFQNVAGLQGIALLVGTKLFEEKEINLDQFELEYVDNPNDTEGKISLWKKMMRFVPQKIKNKLK